MNIHEYQAKAVLREFGVPVPRGHAAFSVEEAVKAANDLGTPVARRQGADPCRRARQGRRRQGREVDRGRAQGGRAPARLRPGHASDRPARQAGQPPLYRGRLGDRPRVLSLGAGRPRDLAHRLRGVDRGRHGHRGGARTPSREDHDLLGRSGDRHHAASRPPGGAGAGAQRRSRQAGRAPGGASSTPPSSPRT